MDVLCKMTPEQLAALSPEVARAIIEGSNNEYESKVAIVREMFMRYGKQLINITEEETVTIRTFLLRYPNTQFYAIFTRAASYTEISWFGGEQDLECKYPGIMGLLKLDLFEQMNNNKLICLNSCPNINWVNSQIVNIYDYMVRNDLLKIAPITPRNTK